MASMTLPAMESQGSFLKRKDHLLITPCLVVLQFLRYVVNMLLCQIESLRFVQYFII